MSFFFSLPFPLLFLLPSSLCVPHFLFYFFFSFYKGFYVALAGIQLAAWVGVWKWNLCTPWLCLLLVIALREPIAWILTAWGFPQILYSRVFCTRLHSRCLLVSFCFHWAHCLGNSAHSQVVCQIVNLYSLLKCIQLFEYAIILFSCSWIIGLFPVYSDLSIILMLCCCIQCSSIFLKYIKGILFTYITMKISRQLVVAIKELQNVIHAS